MPKNRSPRPLLAVLGGALLISSLGSAVSREAGFQESQSAVLTDVRVTTQAGEIDFDLLISGRFRFALSELSNPPRLILDLEPVEKKWSGTQISIQSFGLAAVRASQFEPRKARVVFDLIDPNPLYRVSQTPEGVRVAFLKKAIAETPPAPAQPQPKAEVPPAPKEVTPPSAVAAGLAPAPGLPSTLLGLSVVAYRLTDERFVEIFGSRSGFSLGFEFEQFFLPKSRIRPGFGVDTHRVSKEGLSTISRTPTALALDPVTISAYLLVDGRPVSPYLGVGLALCHYHEKSALHDSEGSGTGVALLAGTFVHLGRLDYLKLRLWGRWSKVSVLVNDVSADLGGLAAGLSVLAGFNI